MKVGINTRDRTIYVSITSGAGEAVESLSLDAAQVVADQLKQSIDILNKAQIREQMDYQDRSISS